MKRWQLAYVDNPADIAKNWYHGELAELVNSGWEPFAVVPATLAHPERMWLRKRGVR